MFTSTSGWRHISRMSTFAKEREKQSEQIQITQMSSVEKEVELAKAEVEFRKQLFGFANAPCLVCAIKLGIPEAINNHGKPISLSQLVSVLEINPSKATQINRLMRILVSTGYVIEQRLELSPDTENSFSLTSTGRLLIGEKALAMLVMASSSWFVKPWSFLSDWFKSTDDKNPFEMAHGKNLWSYMAEDLSTQKIFNEALAGESDYTATVLAERCTFAFEGVKSLVDLGGGTGNTSRIIAKEFPGLNCLVYDLPHVVANEQGAGNLKFLGGNMFDEVPEADAILLKSVLHDWTDEDCIKILINCKKALSSKGEGGKLLVDEIVMESHQDLDKAVVAAQNYFDMQMLVAFNSKERTEKEFATLFEKAGFSGYKIYPLLGVKSLIEVYP